MKCPRERAARRGGRWRYGAAQPPRRRAGPCQAQLAL